MIVTSRINPPLLPQNVIIRERINKLVQESIEKYRLTLVHAVAGAGKTVAVATATSLLERPVVWLSLEKSDVAPGRLLTYIDAAITLVSGIPSILKQTRENQIPLTEVAGVLAETLPSEAVVVIDNLERVEADSEAWSLLDSLLRYAPLSVAFVFIGRRAVPPGVLDQSFTYNIGQVGLDHLAVTVDEAAELLRSVGQPEDQAVHRVRIAGGWMAGVIYGGTQINAGETNYGYTLLGSVAKIVKLEHAWRRLDGRHDDGFQVAPFPG